MGWMTVHQKLQLRKYYAETYPQPTQAACVKWFQDQFDTKISQSQVSRVLSDRKLARVGPNDPAIQFKRLGPEYKVPRPGSPPVLPKLPRSARAPPRPKADGPAPRVVTTTSFPAPASAPAFRPTRVSTSLHTPCPADPRPADPRRPSGTADDDDDDSDESSASGSEASSFATPSAGPSQRQSTAVLRPQGTGTGTGTAAAATSSTPSRIRRHHQAGQAPSPPVLNHEVVWRHLVHTACEGGFLELVKGLVEAGLDIDKRDSVGNTPLHVAAYAGHLEIVRFLVGKEADVDAVNHAGWTAAHLATTKGHDKCVHFLLLQNANPWSRFSIPEQA
ncbi:hypothetical protein GGR56DRAFT_163622 [Xylariaceae sp. FL0804]|nr:hypothetical protein GGR56DRAFT_163622 [Xylariaceae sp. FL0804]